MLLLGVNELSEEIYAGYFFLENACVHAWLLISFQVHFIFCQMKEKLGSQIAKEQLA